MSFLRWLWSLLTGGPVIFEDPAATGISGARADAEDDDADDDDDKAARVT